MIARAIYRLTPYTDPESSMQPSIFLPAQHFTDAISTNTFSDSDQKGLVLAQIVTVSRAYSLGRVSSMETFVVGDD